MKSRSSNSNSNSNSPKEVEAPAEKVGRKVLLIGFVVLLLLIMLIGYLSGRSFSQVEKEIARLHEGEAARLRLVLEMAKTVGKIETEARTVLATTEDSLLRFPAERELELLRDEMKSHIDAGRKSTLNGSTEWAEFEAAYAGFWDAIKTYDQGPVDWSGDRQRLSRSIQSLETKIQTELDDNDRRSQEVSRLAGRRVGLATAGVLLVGLVVAVLTLHEIGRILNRLNRAYRSSAESYGYLQSLLDSLVSGVVVLDQNGVLVTVNTSFEVLTGTRESDLIGKHHTDVLIDKEVLGRAIESRLDKADEPNLYCCRVELGAGRLFDVFASPLTVTEERRGLILVFVDITEVERAQTELRRNRALTAVGQMTAQIAHEIKNPLGSIRFAVELLSRQLKNSNGKEHEVIGIIERSVDHLAAVVTELCEFSRPKELNRDMVNLNTLLDELLPMVADRLNEKQVAVSRQYSPEMPIASFDRAELKKLFLNLLINAIDASDAGGEIQLRTVFDPSGFAVVSVADHGCGMDIETRRRLFEPFYTTKQTGTGLGMSIAKKIAELHSGDIGVVTEQGRGTTLTVRLPIQSCAAVARPDN